MIGAAILGLLRRLLSGRCRRAVRRLEILGDLLERVHDAVYVIRIADGRFVLANRRFEELLGVPREEVEAGRISPLDLVAPEDRAFVAERMARRRRGEPIADRYEFRALSRGGEVRYVEVDTAPVSRGGERFIYGVCRDMTEKRRVLDRLREEQELLRSLFDGIDEVIYVADMETHEILYANRRTRDVVGSDPVGRICYEVLQEGQDGPCSFCTNDRLVKDGRAVGPHTWEFTNTRNGRTYRCMDRAIRWRDGRLVRFELAVDITQQRELEAKVGQAKKLEALGNLVGGMAHEFNNLGGGILGSASLALSRLGPGDPGRRELLRIAESARRAGDLVHRLLGYRRGRTPAGAEVDLSGLVLEIAGDLEERLPGGVRLHADLAPGPLRVTGDGRQIRQAIRSLIENSLDAMPSGGDLFLATRHLPDPGSAVRADGRPAEGPHCLITVSDTGEGIAEEVLARVVEPFFTTREGRSGLGLSVAHAMVRNAGGFLEIRSEPGRGTDVVVGLPVRAERPSVPPASEAPRPARGARTVLVVDDEEVVREVAGEIFEEEGFCVLRAPGGQEALAALDQGGVDVVVLDLAMPGMTGQETIRRIRDRGQKVPVVLCSGFAGTSPRELCESLGAQGFVGKPYDVDELLGAVRTALGSPAPGA